MENDQDKGHDLIPKRKRLTEPTHSKAKKPRIQICNPKQKTREKFIYGNYNKYYGYRNEGEVFHDVRLDIFEGHREIFIEKDILDIGCNSGLITFAVAENLPIKSIVGIDIDRGLIKNAQKTLARHKRALNACEKRNNFPYNISFVHANYVLRHDVLLEIEVERFDLIMCLSVTKWIHLNFGDAGLKQAFRRMYMQLRFGGKLILEAQSFDNYKRRKKMTENIFANYKSMRFFPQHFTEYLLSAEVGFTSVELMGMPEQCTAGFKRPIQIFHKT